MATVLTFNPNPKNMQELRRALPGDWNLPMVRFL